MLVPQEYLELGPLRVPLYSLPQAAVMCGMIMGALLAWYCIAQLPSAVSTLVGTGFPRPSR